MYILASIRKVLSKVTKVYPVTGPESPEGE
jgi:hypothetical protein